MKKKFTTIDLLMVFIVLLPIGYLLIIWNSISASVFLHYNLQMEPDKIGSKNELWGPVLIIAGASLLSYFLLKNINKIDPKRRKAGPSSVFKMLAIGLLVFMSALNFLIIYSVSSKTNLMNSLLFPLLGLLLAYVGNFLNNIKPNYFAGFRLPWTLSDDTNWRQTHHLASKLWFWSGLGLSIICLLLPFKWVLPVFICTVAFISLVPALYSYNLFKKHKTN